MHLYGRDAQYLVGKCIEVSLRVFFGWVIWPTKVIHLHIQGEAFWQGLHILL